MLWPLSLLVKRRAAPRPSWGRGHRHVWRVLSVLAVAIPRAGTAQSPPSWVRAEVDCAETGTVPIEQVRPATTTTADAPLHVQVCRQRDGRDRVALLVRDHVATSPQPSVPATSCGPRSLCLAVYLGDSTGRQWRLSSDASSVTVWAEQLPTAPTGRPIRVQDGPWQVAHLAASESANPIWQLHVLTAPGVRLLGVRVVAPDGTVWGATLSGVMIHDALAEPESPAIHGDSVTPLTSDAPWARSHWAVTTSAATPHPDAVRPGGRLTAGLLWTAGVPGHGVLVAAAPVPVLPLMEPLTADPNRRYPRIAPESRVDLAPWRDALVGALWLDTRRVEPALGVATARDTAHGDLRLYGAVGETGHASVLAVGVGDPAQHAVAVRANALRDPLDQTRAQVGDSHAPWRGALTAAGTIGTLTAGSRRPTLSYEWTVTGTGRGLDQYAQGGGVRLVLPVSATGGVVLEHERLTPGFATRGSAYALADGLETSRALVTAAPSPGNTVTARAQWRTPSRATTLFVARLHGSSEHELALAGEWTHTFSRTGSSRPATVATVGATGASYAVGPLAQPLRPGLSLDITTYPARGWQLRSTVDAEATPLFATGAPGRVARASIGVTRETPGGTVALLGMAARAWQCGAAVVPPVVRDTAGAVTYSPYRPTPVWEAGCVGAGTTLAGALHHAVALGHRGRHELEIRFVADQVVLGSLLDGRVQVPQQGLRVRDDVHLAAAGGTWNVGIDCGLRPAAPALSGTLPRCVALTSWTRPLAP